MSVIHGTDRKRVVIVGMGFGGVHAAQELAGSNLEVVLVDRNNYHLFQPLLYQVATAGLEQESIAYPVRALVRGWYNLAFRMGEVTGLDLNAQKGADRQRRAWLRLSDSGWRQRDQLLWQSGIF